MQLFLLLCDFFWLFIVRVLMFKSTISNFLCLPIFLIESSSCCSIFISSLLSDSHSFRLLLIKPSICICASEYFLMLFYGISDVYEGCHSIFQFKTKIFFFINVLLWIWFFNWQGSGHYLCQVLVFILFLSAIWWGPYHSRIFLELEPSHFLCQLQIKCQVSLS